MKKKTYTPVRIDSAPVVQINKVVKRYAFSGTGNFYALNNVSLTIEKGEFVAIVGTSGSGKSTLMHILGGVDAPTSGSVRICGVDLYNLDDDALSAFRREEIGMVFQFFNLIPVLNVEENIAFPVIASGRRPSFDEVQKLMDRLGIGRLGTSLPNQLSGGQQQRVVIGRAVINRPSLILADEPTGNLDSRNSAEVIRLLETMCRDRQIALVLVTHDHEIAARADRVLRIEDGKIISDVRQNAAAEPVLREAAV